MLATKEQVKQRIIEYLRSPQLATQDFRAFTRSQISHSVPAHAETLETALSDLERENVIATRQMNVQVYLPRDERGNNVLMELARTGFLSYSPYWSFLFGLAIVFLLIALYPLPIQVPNEVDTVTRAYRSGLMYGIGYSFLGGIIGGYLFQNLMSRFLRWQALYVNNYLIIATIAKRSVYLFILLSVIYYLGSVYLSYPFQQPVLAALLGVSVTVAFGIHRVLDRRIQRVDA